MRAFLQFDRQKGRGFVSALCSGLLVAILALASPAFAAGGRIEKCRLGSSRLVRSCSNGAACEPWQSHERSEPTGSSGGAGALAGAPLAICARVVEGAGRG